MRGLYIYTSHYLIGHFFCKVLIFFEGTQESK